MTYFSWCKGKYTEKKGELFKTFSLTHFWTSGNTHKNLKAHKNINTMLKAVSINKKKIKDKNTLASNHSVIVEHVIQDKNWRVLSRNDIEKNFCVWFPFFCVYFPLHQF